MNWHFFKNGDLVEFKDPETGELCQRKIFTEPGFRRAFDHFTGETVRYSTFYTFVMVGLKKTSVLDAPLMRLIRNPSDGVAPSLSAAQLRRNLENNGGSVASPKNDKDDPEWSTYVRLCKKFNNRTFEL